KFVGGFIGSPKMNFLDGKLDNGNVQVAGSPVQLQRAVGANGAPVTFGVLPEHITLREGGGVPLAEVTVDLVEQLCGATMLYTTTADRQPLTIAMDGQQQVALGSKATAYVDPARTHIFGADGLAL